MKRLLTKGLILVLCLGLCACSSSGSSSSGSKKDKKSSSDSKDKDKKDKDQDKDKDYDEKKKEEDAKNDKDNPLSGLLGGLGGKDPDKSDDKDDKSSGSKPRMREYCHVARIEGDILTWQVYEDNIPDHLGLTVHYNYDDGMIEYQWNFIDINTYSHTEIDNPSTKVWITSYSDGGQTDEGSGVVDYSETVVKLYRDNGMNDIFIAYTDNRELVVPIEEVVEGYSNYSRGKRPYDVEGSDSGSSDSGKKTSERNIVHKFYELVTVDGHTREDFQNDQELADSYNLWDFIVYGTGVEVSLDYDNGYIQYSWYVISTNAYSTAPIDNPNEVDCLLDYTGYLNADAEPDWIPITVSYSDDTIVQTFTEGGSVLVYKLAH